MVQKSKAATLTGALLAPKGGAEPASPPTQTETDNGATAGQALPPDEVARIGAPASEGDEENAGGFQFPLRLDPASHLELRLAAARSGMSCQEIIVEALARHLADIAAGPGDTETPRPGGAE